jgi:hypothetical protein
MNETDGPMIIKLDWKKITGIPLRYVSHIFFARIENDNVIAPPPPDPYANIFVEAPELAGDTLIQVSHKLDFYNLWILNEKGLLEDDEVEIIIKHKRPTGMKKLMAAILPHLEYSVFNRGYLEAIHDPKQRDFAAEQKPYIYLYDQERRMNIRE